MFEVMKMAGRNLSRYRRRTLLTLLLIVIGMLAVLLFIAVTGSFKSMMVGQITDSVLAEWFRNGSGYTTDEMSAFYELVRTSAANPALVQPASRAATQGYNRPNAAQRYAYLRVSQKEPFDILYFTPALTLIANTADNSWTLIPELLYTGIKNVELRARAALNRGRLGSEYGEKPVRSRLELRARFFF